MKFTKTQAGFGGLAGTGSPKSFPLHFLMPSPERDGQEGWLFSPPLASELETLPKAGISENDFAFKWYPEREWSEPELKMGQFQRIYGLLENCVGIGWTKAYFNYTGINEYKLKGRTSGPIRIYLDDQEIYRSDHSNEFREIVKVPYGKHDIVVISSCTGTDWGFQIGFTYDEESIELFSPYPVKGQVDTWLYLGPFAETALPQINKVKSMNQLFQGVNSLCYWRLDQPDVWVRPYLENQNFGSWNYPLGVTLYGLVQTGRLLDCSDMVAYVLQHVEACTTNFQYAFWDKDQYGAAGVLHLLTTIDSLDDCGSFGSMMLELAQLVNVRNYREVADFIAGYIRRQQIRLPDGAFFRKNVFHAFMDDTLWADDLYMCVPFLCRYYQLTGEYCYIDDAAGQLLLYHQYLYIPEQKIMSHVFDVKIAKPTRVPWGRGNGWVAFSFSELLAVLPEDHRDRPALLKIFKDLCEGYLALQDEDGMWHQVLTDLESYPESSCTSMFIYAFARGIRYGWLEDKDKYLQAVIKAWNGLSQISIDYQGNIYGVCRGSGFSFTADYYRNDLSWNLNDTHGIGIVMLAGVEVLNTLKTLHQDNEYGGNIINAGTKNKE